eukprot:CAMPEP_0195126878 /NCGR_PEP_ID=MMETSP0448-20130528/135874_1 /TAXON_ID=66468 /ORGANISM="Heterocapsa triquestra, Strain CCMP 448" /LENGTH=165 /DNA_ID=CAMNT_0040164585 /DNA_START=18 /DNA_END=511 /DNA_ORIENTATION=-
MPQEAVVRNNTSDGVVWSIARAGTTDSLGQTTQSFLASAIIRETVDAGVEAGLQSGLWPSPEDDGMQTAQASKAEPPEPSSPAEPQEPLAGEQEKPESRGLPMEDKAWVGSVLSELSRNLSLSPRHTPGSTRDLAQYLDQGGPPCGLHLDTPSTDDRRQASQARR